MGILEGRELEELESHLQTGCPECLRGIAEAQEALTLLACSVPQRTPPARVRARILDQVAGQALPSPAVTASRFRIPEWAWACAAALVIFAVVAGGWWTYDQRGREIAKLRQELSVRRIPDQPLLVAPLPQVQTSPATPKPVAPDNAARLRALQLDLEEARRSGQEALAAQESKIARLQDDLEKQRKLFLSEQSQWRAREHSYEGALGEKEASLQEVRKQLTAYSTEIDKLKRQVEQFRNASDLQGYQVEQYRQISTLLKSPGVRFVRLRGTQSGPEAAGHAFVLDNTGVLLYAFNLPSLPRDRNYQLWLIRGRSPAIVSGGVFIPDAQKAAFVRVSGSAGLADIKALAITDEPAGGSPKPTGHKFLVGASPT